MTPYSSVGRQILSMKWSFPLFLFFFGLESDSFRSLGLSSQLMLQEHGCKMGLPVLRDQIGRCWIKTLETPVLPWQPELTLSYFFVQQRHLLESFQTAFLCEVSSWWVECSVFPSFHNGKSVGGETAKIFTVFSHHLELHTPGKCQALCYQRAFLKKTGENWKE